MFFDPHPSRDVAAVIAYLFDSTKPSTTRAIHTYTTPLVRISLPRPQEQPWNLLSHQSTTSYLCSKIKINHYNYPITSIVMHIHTNTAPRNCQHQARSPPGQPTIVLVPRYTTASTKNHTSACQITVMQ